MRANYSLASITSWQIGGPADFYAEPTNEIELEAALRQGFEQGLPITFLGGGTNVLIGDKGVRGLVIGLRKFSKIIASEDGGRLRI